MYADPPTQIKKQEEMKKDIILAGVGGQGILTIATIIGDAATVAGLNLKQAEVHGMSQRGGDVQSNLRLSTDLIHSDLIKQGAADLIISMEPMEALRYLPLSPFYSIYLHKFTSSCFLICVGGSAYIPDEG